MADMEWRAVVYSLEGFLLGGVKRHASSWMTERRDAFDWGWTVRDINRQAGRDVDPNIVVEAREVRS
jgi:hypothetical protein